MIREVHRFEYECDVCHFRIIESRVARGKQHLPKDWSTFAVHDCGATGYSKECIRCACCTKKDAR